MRLQVTLLLVCVLFPKALTLKCYQCMSGVSGQCTDTQTDCPDQCGSMTTAVYTGGLKTAELNVKSCAVAGQCLTGSQNLGFLKTTINSKCCSTDLCNSYKPPALPKGSPNGRKCYTCVDDDCSGIVNCEGDEDQCMSATVNSGGVQLKMKGCVSRSLCAAGGVSTQAAGVTGSVSCCEGNLCNGGPILPQSSPNGRKCYTCVNDDCSRTVNCEGDEDQCISGRVNTGGVQVKMKGCASRSFCSADASSMQTAGVTGSVSCCERDLCNSAEGVKLSLLIMLVPLISSILFL